MESDVEQTPQGQSTVYESERHPDRRTVDNYPDDRTGVRRSFPETRRGPDLRSYINIELTSTSSRGLDRREGATRKTTQRLVVPETSSDMSLLGPGVPHLKVPGVTPKFPLSAVTVSGSRKRFSTSVSSGTRLRIVPRRPIILLCFYCLRFMNPVLS